MNIGQLFALECHTNTQPTVFVTTYILFSVALRGELTTTLAVVSCSHALRPIHVRSKAQSTRNNIIMIMCRYLYIISCVSFVALV